MSEPTLYHVVSATDGTVCLQIEDGPFIAVGERDILHLESICALAIQEIGRRKDMAQYRGMRS